MVEAYTAWVDDLMDELVPGEGASIRGREDSITVVSLFADARYALAQGLKEVEEATGDDYGYQAMFEVDGFDERVQRYGVGPDRGTGKRGSAIDVYLDQLRDLSEMRLDEAFDVAAGELEALGYEEGKTVLKDVAEDGVAGATQKEVKPGMATVRLSEELRQELYTLGKRGRDALARDIMGIDDGDA